MTRAPARVREGKAASWVEEGARRGPCDSSGWLEEAKGTPGAPGCPSYSSEPVARTSAVAVLLHFPSSSSSYMLCQLIIYWVYYKYSFYLRTKNRELVCINHSKKLANVFLKGVLGVEINLLIIGNPT